MKNPKKTELQGAFTGDVVDGDLLVVDAAIAVSSTVDQVLPGRREHGALNVTERH